LGPTGVKIVGAKIARIRDARVEIVVGIGSDKAGEAEAAKEEGVTHMDAGAAAGHTVTRAAMTEVAAAVPGRVVPDVLAAQVAGIVADGDLGLDLDLALAGTTMAKGAAATTFAAVP